METVFYIFRNRWFALIWVVLICARVALFAGVGGGLVGGGLFGAGAFSSKPADEATIKQAKFNAWVEEDRKQNGYDTGSDSSRTDRDTQYSGSGYSGSGADSGNSDSGSSSNQ